MFFAHNLVNIGAMIVGSQQQWINMIKNIFARLELQYIDLEVSYWQLIMYAKGDIGQKVAQNWQEDINLYWYRIMLNMCSISCQNFRNAHMRLRKIKRIEISGISWHTCGTGDVSEGTRTLSDWFAVPHLVKWNRSLVCMHQTPSFANQTLLYCGWWHWTV